MKTYTFLALLMLTLVLNAAAPQKNVSAAENNLSKAEGQMISLDKFKGSVLALYFFGNNINNWDYPIAQLNRLKEKYENKNVKIGALTSKTREEIDAYMKTIDFIVFAKSIDFAVVTDSDSAKKYKIKPPYVYVIAQDGTIFWKGKSLKNADNKIVELLNNHLPAQNEGTNVYNDEIEGEVTHFKNTTPKLNLDDSNGIPDPGVPEGTTFYKENQPEKVTPATEAEELDEDTRDQIPNQRIEEYEGTPGIKETEREYEERSIMSPNDD